MGGYGYGCAVIGTGGYRRYRPGRHVPGHGHTRRRAAVVAVGAGGRDVGVHGGVGTVFLKSSA